ncbi:MAG: sugar phosphate isomerase/epimerase [Candidatus Bathyarchaeota archaeon]|nr:sugar phosphate isomerase/epimerase [Candidatus Bathyarchaeota archaeon]
MELAASTLHLLDKPLEQVLPDLINLSTRNIELADSGLHSLNPKIVERLQDLRASYELNFSVHAPYADTNLSADDDLIREWILKRIRASIRFASELEAKCLVVHPGWTTATDRFMKGKAWELNLRSLLWLLRYAEEYGVSMLVENVPEPTPYLLITVNDFELFYEEMQLDIGMVLDVAHANLQGETLDFIDRFSDKIKHLHVSDNHGESDQHLPIGEGSIDWKQVLDHAGAAGFDGWVVIESYRDMEKSLEYLRPLI